MAPFIEKYRTYIALGLLAFIALSLVILLPRRPQEPIKVVSATATAPKELKVYISGAIAKPGVYTFSEGARIEDALSAAGGASSEADLNFINLAAKVQDGQHIRIPKLGEAAQAQLININTAPQGLLETLPGVGPVLALRIIDSRTKEGPFTDPKQLVDRKLISQSIYEQIKDMVAAQ